MDALRPTLPYTFARRHGVLLLGDGVGVGASEGADAPMRVALREGGSPDALLEARRVLARALQVEMLAPAQFDRRLSEIYADAGVGDAAEVEQLGLQGDLDALIEDIPATADLLESQGDAPVIRLINGLIAEAVRLGASDLHIEPFESALRVRFRVDGMMREALSLPARIAPLLVSRVKVMARLDIAERRLPQDGRLSMRASGQAMDIRASALPGVHGESIVLRLLPKERKDLGLERLGMAPDHLAMLSAWSREAHGIILVTGPTGSGKSTTLYATLAASNDGLKKIITVEDPVEFQLPGITQVQTHADIGLDFASVLRSMLRQDPDVVMVGEIRDRETAEIAIQAALTGHLVLSTVHTNDSLGAFTRLIDMGVEPFLVATPMRGLQAQRLVRRLCPHCAVPAATVLPAIAGETARWAHQVLGDAPAQWMQAVGCPRCQGTGYRGRIGIYELVPVDETMQQAVVSGATHLQLKAMARERGCRFLREDGLLKAWQGITTVDEVLRVTAV